MVLYNNSFLIFLSISKISSKVGFRMFLAFSTSLKIIFSISKAGINYENEEIENWVGKIIVFLFTGLNSFVMPFLMKLFKKLQDGEIDGSVFKVRFIVILIIFIICLFLECGYMESIQQGILRVYRANIGN